MTKLWIFYQITTSYTNINQVFKNFIHWHLFVIHQWENHKRFWFKSPIWNDSYWFAKNVQYNWSQHFNCKEKNVFPRLQVRRQSSVKWYTSYLSNRKFITSMENVYSDKPSITCGVPQDLILGPMLFLIYIRYNTSYHKL